MERYTTPYLLVSKVLHERGLSNELATVPLQAGTRVIGLAISEVVQCVPSLDYPILIALLRSTADTLAAQCSDDAKELADTIRDTIDTVLIKTKADGSPYGGEPV